MAAHLSLNGRPSATMATLTSIEGILLAHAEFFDDRFGKQQRAVEGPVHFRLASWCLILLTVSPSGLLLHFIRGWLV